MQYLTILYGLIGLSFLIFIHELGHFLVALYFKMDVSVFSIGFGPTIYSKERGGITYRLGLIPFGGYVKIKGMDEESNEEGSFFEKKPYQRLLMVLAGPFTNILFAFVGFSVIYFNGGFLKNFSETSSIIGMVDPASKIYEKGVKPGDQIESINGAKFFGRKDLFFQSLLMQKQSRVCGQSIDHIQKTKTFFDYTVAPLKKTIHGYEVHSLGISAPASFLIHDSKRIKGDVFFENSPFKDCNLLDGDRIIWVNGELLFCREQLVDILSQNSCLITFLRDGKVMVQKVIKSKISDLKFNIQEKEELLDLKFDAKIDAAQDIDFIPYMIDQDGVVVKSIDPKNVLQPKDEILAVDGIKTVFGSDVMKLLQDKHVVTIVAHGSYKPLPIQQGDEQFFEEIDFSSLNKVINQIGVATSEATDKNLRLLKTVQPLKIEYEGETYYRLGVHLVDRQVVENPTPFTSMQLAFKDMKKTLTHLTRGDLSPKFLSGPVGIVGAMQRSWMEGFNEGLFWLSTISLNLGVMNLLPLPVLDGGHVVFTFFEMVTKRKMNRKLMERLIVPFVLLFIGLAIFTTIHDLQKIFSLIR